MAKKKVTTKKVSKKVGKKVAKKTAKKKTAKRAGAQRPSYKVDAAANRKQTMRKSKWVGKLPVGNTIMRYIPPMGTSAVITLQTCLHYTVQREDDPTKTIAPGCLRAHGDGNCYICNFVDWCLNHEDTVIQAIGDDLGVRETCKAQVFVLDTASKTWEGPKIFSLPAKVTKLVESLLAMSEETGNVQFCDPYGGQSMMINREGTGRYDTRYTPSLVGDVSNLDDIIPGWEDKAYKNLWKELDVKMLDVNKQKERLVATFPDLPWEDIEEAIG